VKRLSSKPTGEVSDHGPEALASAAAEVDSLSRLDGEEDPFPASQAQAKQVATVQRRYCNGCGRTYDPQGGYHRSGKCQVCTRTYERERARVKPSRLVRNSARFKKLREQIKARDHHRCRRCGSSHRLDVHHRVPLHRGGDPYDPANLETLCSDCHSETTRRPITQAKPRFSRQTLH
jgi:5-methylcytosine-specific restriction endonuclease McrA